MSHHNSGPRAHALPIGDITDMYGFTVPGSTGRLALVLDTVPFADPHGFLSDALIYRFRIRPLTPAPTTPALFQPSGPDREITIDVTFDAPVESDGARTQRGHCAVSNGWSVDFDVNDEAGGAGEGRRVFAGPRWDPFFDDANQLVKTITTGVLSFDPATGAILGDGKNVFAVVVEIDLTGILGDDLLVGVVGEEVIAGKIPMRWERFGRPELENAIMGMKQYDTLNRDFEIRDVFNAEDVFALGKDYANAYRARLNANLAFWDGLDGAVDWPLAGDGTHPLTELLLADYLIVDVAKPFSDDGYLEIERAAQAGRPHETSGGRSPNADAMNVTYTYLVRAGKEPFISDGVTAASRPATDTFPYLVAPNPNPPEHAAH